MLSVSTIDETYYGHETEKNTIYIITQNYDTKFITQSNYCVHLCFIHFILDFSFWISVCSSPWEPTRCQCTDQLPSLHVAHHLDIYTYMHAHIHILYVINICWSSTVTVTLPVNVLQSILCVYITHDMQHSLGVKLWDSYG